MFSLTQPIILLIKINQRGNMFQQFIRLPSSGLLVDNCVIEKKHCALGFVNVFITNAAPTCFDTYMPSSGSTFVLVSTWKLRQLCMVSGNMN
jgi:hypothetical protein